MTTGSRLNRTSYTAFQISAGSVVRKHGACGSTGCDIERVISMIVGFSVLLLAPLRVGTGSLMTKGAIVSCCSDELRVAVGFVAGTWSKSCVEENS